MIDKLGPVERVQERPHSTGHVPTEENRPETNHREHPTRSDCICLSDEEYIHGDEELHSRFSCCTEGA